MKENPASSIAFRLPADSIPASATTTIPVTPWRSWKACSTGRMVVVSAVLPSNRWTSSGNPDGSTSSPTWTWGSTQCSLLIPTLRIASGPVSSSPTSKCNVVTLYMINAERPPAADENAVHALATLSR